MVRAIGTVQTDHRGATHFPAVGVTLGGGSSAHLSGPIVMQCGALLQYQLFVSHHFHFLENLKEVKAFPQLWVVVQLFWPHLNKLVLARKKPRLEVSVSAPQPKAVTTNQLSQSTQVGNACATGTVSTQVRRDESFAKLGRKAQLYETAKDSF